MGRVYTGQEHEKQEVWMILTALLGALAGFAARPAEPKITEIFGDFLGESHLPQEGDRKVLAFATCLAVAAIVLWIGSEDASPFVFAVSAGLGYFQAEIREAILNRRA